MGRVAKEISLFLAAVVSVYVVVTWFFFGTPHPCGIAVALVKYEYSHKTQEERASTEAMIERLLVEWQKVDDAIRRTVKAAAKAEREGRTKDKAALLGNLLKLNRKRTTIEALMEVTSDPIKIAEDYVKELSPARCASSAIGHIKRMVFEANGTQK